MPKAYSYIVARDYGFAPNPFYGVLTLATCKPGIRKTASVGDLIIGCSDKAHGNKLIYVAQVSEVLTFDQYWNELRFAKKKPVMNGSFKKLYGDNPHPIIMERYNFELNSIINNNYQFYYFIAHLNKLSSI